MSIAYPAKSRASMLETKGVYFGRRSEVASDSARNVITPEVL
ncbi:UNVERIFIED_ORG: hypothetical protein ABID33_002270 [Xanthobacter viscosus]